MNNLLVKFKLERLHLIAGVFLSILFPTYNSLYLQTCNNTATACLLI